jgi:hypothetical protein
VRLPGKYHQVLRYSDQLDIIRQFVAPAPGLAPDDVTVPSGFVLENVDLGSLNRNSQELGWLTLRVWSGPNPRNGGARCLISLERAVNIGKAYTKLSGEQRQLAAAGQLDLIRLVVDCID